MIASESCFARGVDHCLASDDDHLIAPQGPLNPLLAAQRSALRACLEIIDLIAAIFQVLSLHFKAAQNSVSALRKQSSRLKNNFDETHQHQHPTSNPTTTMSSKPKSRWADDDEDAALEAQRKREKEEKKRLKAEKQRKADEAALRLKAQQETSQTQEPPTKRRKISPSPQAELPPAKLLRFPAPDWKKCRSVEDYEKLNDIEEGAYGWVSRAKDSKTGKVVALKRLKMDNANDGVPVTGLREIQTLMDCEHVNIVGLREVVVGEDTRKIEKYAFSPSIIPSIFFFQDYLLFISKSVS